MPKRSSSDRRAEDAESITRVRADSWRETYRGMIPQSCLDAMKLDLRREFQHVGIGRRLVSKTATALSRRDTSTLIVWVIAGNKRARAFYKRLGAELVVEQSFQWDGMDLVEAGYGSRTLDALIAPAPAAPPPGAVMQ